MSSHTVTLPEILAVLRLFWHRQGIACPPLDLPYIRTVVEANGIRLPPVFEQMYCAVNGTPELYPNYMDENYCSFLPVEELRAEERELLVLMGENRTREVVPVMVFVDFMHRSWEYGLIVDANGRDYRIGIMPTRSSFQVLSNSLTTFLMWYVEDADILYTYNDSLLG